MPIMAGVLTIAFAAVPLKFSTQNPMPSSAVSHAEEARRSADGPWVSPGFRIGLIATYVEAVQRTVGLKDRAEELAGMVATLEARRLTDAEETILETWLPEDMSDRERDELETLLAGNPSEEKRVEIESRIVSDLAAEERIAVEKKLRQNRAIDAVLVPLRGELASVEAELRTSRRIEKEVLDAIVKQEVSDDVVRAVNEFIWPSPKPENGKTQNAMPKASLVEKDAVSPR